MFFPAYRTVNEKSEEEIEGFFYELNVCVLSFGGNNLNDRVSNEVMKGILDSVQCQEKITVVNISGDIC